MVKLTNLILNVVLLLCSTNGIRLISWDRFSNSSGFTQRQINGISEVRGISVRDGVANKSLVTNEISKRGETVDIQAQGSGTTVIVVTAAGVWGTVTIGSCGACAFSAGINIPGCTICAAGMLGTLIGGAIACTLGKACGSYGSVTANLGTRDLGITMIDKYYNGTHMLNHFTLDKYPDFTLYAAVGDNNTRIVSHVNNEYNPNSVSEMMKIVDTEWTKTKRDNYDISWVSYEFDNQNVDLTREFSNSYENDPSFFNEHAAVAFAAGGTTKYCMSLALGYDDNSYQNAIHGEMYTNNYGGVDGFCNQNNDDTLANVDCSLVWHEDGGDFMEWGC